MNTYSLKYTQEKNIYFENMSPMFPVKFREKIDKLAGKPITDYGPELGGFFGSFANTFVVKAEFGQFFLETILPQIGNKIDSETNRYVVWDKDEEIAANEI